MYNESYFNRKAELTSSTCQLRRNYFKENSEDLKDIVSILRKNEQRLQLLTSVRSKKT
jgi:flagellar hook-basal body complex protein FliE